MAIQRTQISRLTRSNNVNVREVTLHNRIKNVHRVIHTVTIINQQQHRARGILQSRLHLSRSILALKHPVKNALRRIHQTGTLIEDSPNFRNLSGIHARVLRCGSVTRCQRGRHRLLRRSPRPRNQTSKRNQQRRLTRTRITRNHGVLTLVQLESARLQRSLRNTHGDTPQARRKLGSRHALPRNPRRQLTNYITLSRSLRETLTNHRDSLLHTNSGSSHLHLTQTLRINTTAGNCSRNIRAANTMRGIIVNIAQLEEPRLQRSIKNLRGNILRAARRHHAVNTNSRTIRIHSVEIRQQVHAYRIRELITQCRKTIQNNEKRLTA